MSNTDKKDAYYISPNVEREMFSNFGINDMDKDVTSVYPGLTNSNYKDPLDTQSGRDALLGKTPKGGKRKSRRNSRRKSRRNKRTNKRRNNK
jgi:hypothetical protein